MYVSIMLELNILLKHCSFSSVPCQLFSTWEAKQKHPLRLVSKYNLRNRLFSVTFPFWSLYNPCCLNSLTAHVASLWHLLNMLMPTIMLRLTFYFVLSQRLSDTALVPESLRRLLLVLIRDDKQLHMEQFKDFYHDAVGEVGNLRMLFQTKS